jgi:ComF family protein
VKYPDLLRFLFPPVCVVCDKYAYYFCADCQDKIDFLYFRPKLPLLEGLVDELYVLGFYTPPLSTVIKALKYQSLYPIGNLLGDLLHQHLQLPTNLDGITAVPLHPKRQRQRGYNQAELIAKQLANRLNLPYQNLLIRQHHNRNLASTDNHQQRLTIMANAFTINPTQQAAILGQNILIVDDVITTGSTLATCATQLKQAGANKILAVTLAHEG